jgi:hypothetical protein
VGVMERPDQVSEEQFWLMLFHIFEAGAKCGYHNGIEDKKLREGFDELKSIAIDAENPIGG